MTKKETLRKRMVATRRELPAEKKAEASQAIATLLIAQPEWQSAKTVCVYISLSDEVDTRDIIMYAQKQKKLVVAPHIADGVTSLRKFESINDLTAGMFGTMQPREHALLVPSNTVHLFIVPGVAFDRQGHRLGWGKGYYDRLLTNIQVPRIGLAFSQQVVAQVPHTSYDISMTHVITDTEMIICEGGV